jgi:hypothetical protein
MLQTQSFLCFHRLKKDKELVLTMKDVLIAICFAIIATVWDWTGSACDVMKVLKQLNVFSTFCVAQLDWCALMEVQTSFFLIGLSIYLEYGATFDLQYFGEL